PQDRAYSVPQLFEFIEGAALRFGRWVRQAPYVPQCGAVAGIPQLSRITALPQAEQYAALELFRGTMVRHSLVAYRNDDRTGAAAVTFDGDAWLGYRPIRLPGTLAIRERLPAGAAAVLINPDHRYTDLYLPINATQERMLQAIDGERTIAGICAPEERQLARTFFEQLFRWDQIVLDTARAA
ncbi:MAG TPA: hypothetical protein VGP41_12910, partial [Candidatus Lustribacter sp.]|nr:hypothetical protein [Candidatus Lustribacter sp.]